jgi:hypothetical protein
VTLWPHAENFIARGCRPTCFKNDGLNRIDWGGCQLSHAPEICAELKPTALLLDLHTPGEFDTEHVKTRLLDCAEHVLALSVWNDGNSRSLASLYRCATFLDNAQLGTELVPGTIAGAGYSMRDTSDRYGRKYLYSRNWAFKLNIRDNGFLRQEIALRTLI